jgi:PAS domain S-box-containing protein
MLLESEVDLVRVLGLLAAVLFALAVLGFFLAARGYAAYRNATAQLDKTSRSHEHVDRRLLQILDAIPVALVETDTSGKFVFANRAAQQLLGRKNSELLGLRFHSATWGITYPDGRVIPPDLLPAARALRGQTVKGFQHLMMNPATRRKMLVSVTAQPVLNDTGEVVGSTAAIVETESLARAGSEEDRLRKLFEFALSPVLAIDVERKVRDANPAALALLGRRREEVVGRDFVELFVPAEERLAIRTAFTEAVSGQAEFVDEAEGRVVRADGAVRSVVWKNAVVRDEGGEVVGVLSSGEDVSERRALGARADALQAERDRLADSEARFRALAEASADAMWLADAKTGRMLYVSPAYDRLYGESRERILADPLRWKTYVHPEDVEKVESSNARLPDEAPRELEFRIRRADTGEERHVSDLAFVIRDEAGEPKYLAGLARDVTERKIGEANLRRSEARFRSFAEATDELVWMFDVGQGRFDYMSPAYRAIYGEARESVLADPRRWLERVHPDDRSVAERLADAGASGERAEDEYRIVRPVDGETRTLRTAVFPIKDERGEVAVVAGLTRDVTEQRATEASLRDREALLHSMFDAEGVFNGVVERIDDEYRYVTADTGTAKFFGLEEVRNLRAGEVGLSREEIDGWLAMFDEIAATGRPIVKEYPFTVGGRQTGWYLGTFAPLPPSPEGRQRIAFTVVDITERREAEGRLSESEQRFRAFIEVTPQLMWSTDAEGNNDYVSPQWLAYFGGAAEDYVGDRWLAVLHPDDLERTQAVWGAAVERGEPYDIDYRMRGADGEYRWFKGRAAPVRDETGAVVRWFGSCTDIHDVVTARERLEAAVAERTAELEAAHEERARVESALAQSQRLETVGRLTGGVAHDFNNLLQVVIGALDMILRHADKPERVRRLGEAALAAGRRGEKLTRQLLAFSRRQELNFEVLEVGKVVRGFEPLLRRAVDADLPLTIEVNPEAGVSRLDPVQLEAALLNLVVNARDAIGEGAGSIAVRVDPVRLTDGEIADAAAGDYVRIAVSDTGAGMPPEVLARALEPFFTTKEAGKGTGLGLAQVYGFVRQSGGGVKIDSAPGRGTTVALFLPRTTERPADAANAPARDERPLERGRSVLLVEDDAGVRTVAENLLLELGCRVETAGDGPTALARLQAGSPVDLLLTDIVMPGGMSGVELAAEARRLKPELRVLLSTGYAEGKLEAAEAADLPVLQKPYQAEELSQAVRRALG